jgi:hypothetical protein
MIREGLEEERRGRLRYDVGIVEEDAAMHVDAAFAGNNNSGYERAGVKPQGDDADAVFGVLELRAIPLFAESKSSCPWVGRREHSWPAP